TLSPQSGEREHMRAFGAIDLLHRNTRQPPPPVGGAFAATGPTIRSKSACGPGLPWIGTCVATSSFNRLTLLNSTTAFSLTFWRFPPCGGGVYRSALTRIFDCGRYATNMSAA